MIFSSNPIPGNEKAVSKVINELSQKGADVIFQDAHVSGHACQEEIKLIYSLVRPKYCDSGSRRVPSSEGSGGNRPEPGNPEGSYLYSSLRGCA